MTPATRRPKPRTSSRNRGSEQGKILIGCAGWTIPPTAADHFPLTGTHLERYAAVLPAVEINSSFYRPHRRDTYARWAASVPTHFRFSVKAPKVVTHVLKLKEVDLPLEAFLSEVASLRQKLGCILIQLPPSLAFDPKVAGLFFSRLRRRFKGTVACEPRHASWFDSNADALLRDAHVARVAADPAVVPMGAEPGGWNGAVYYRLHGSPKMYYSPYPRDYLQRLAQRLRIVASAEVPVWCMFDNTAGGMAMSDSLGLLQQVTGFSALPILDEPPLATHQRTPEKALLGAPVTDAQMYLAQLRLPRLDGAGKPLAQKLFREVRKELTDRFGGIRVCTSAPVEEASKRLSSGTQRDISVIFEVTSEHMDHQWWSEYRRILERRFREQPVTVSVGRMTFV